MKPLKYTFLTYWEGFTSGWVNIQPLVESIFVLGSVDPLADQEAETIGDSTSMARITEVARARISPPVQQE
ncbi:MAG: hypothetical protein WDA16_07170 [Candidatus Thermoplasmatota archaeon]